MRPARVLLLSSVALAAALLGAEGLIRMRAHARYGRQLDIYDLHQRLPSGLLVPRASLDVPIGDGRHVRTDERGFRSPPVPLPKPPGTVRLAFLGSSTTFCSQVPSNDHTWPALVRAELAGRLAGLHVDYVNAGVTGHLLSDNQQDLSERVAAIEPDVIVIYQAANDLAADTQALAVAAGLVGPSEERGWLERHSLLFGLVRKNQAFLRSQEQGRGERGKLECDLEALARGFEDRLVALVVRAQAVAGLVVLPTAATRFDRAQTLPEQLAHMEQSFTFMHYLRPEDLHRGFELYNAAIARAAARTGALLISDHACLQGRIECFTDSVHLSSAGCQVMAQRVVGGLFASERFTALVSAKRGAR
jgi:lysophospholipase L1-like esterase